MHVISNSGITSLTSHRGERNRDDTLVKLIRHGQISDIDGIRDGIQRPKVGSVKNKIIRSYI